MTDEVDRIIALAERRVPSPVVGPDFDRASDREIADYWIARHSAEGHVPIFDRGVIWVPDAASKLWRSLTPESVFTYIFDLDGFATRYSAKAEAQVPATIDEPKAERVRRAIERVCAAPGALRDDVLAFRSGDVLHVDRDEVVVEPLTLAHRARTVLPVDYDPTWCPEAYATSTGLLAEYLRSTWDEDDRLRAVEVMGVALMGLGTRLKKAWFLADSEEIGHAGGTGKSTYLRLLAGDDRCEPPLSGLVPRERQCSIPPHLMGDDYHGMDLLGATLNVVYETPDAELLREEGIKAIVHGERIRRRRIRCSPVEFDPVALHVFATNQLPDAPGASGAFWDRWEVLEFSRRWRGNGAIADLAQRILQHEMSDLVHLAICGARSALHQHSYTSSTLGAAALTRWRAGADPVAVFVAEWCAALPDESPDSDWVSGADLYGAYRTWCERHGHRPCSSTKFGRRVPARKKRSNGAKYPLRLLDETEIRRRDEVQHA